MISEGINDFEGAIGLALDQPELAFVVRVDRAHLDQVFL